jgi:hypothetical protein
VPTGAIIVVAIFVFLVLTWLFGLRAGTYVAPESDAVGAGTAMIAVGGALVVSGRELA